MGYVDRFIKTLAKSKNEYRKDNKPNISELKAGDVIWAKRYSKEEIKSNTKLEHSEGPFIVIYMDKFNIYCLSCTSQISKRVTIMKLQADNYPHCFYKDTYVIAQNDIEMTNYKFLRKIGTLSKEDFNILKKRLYLFMSSDSNAKRFNFNRDSLKFYLDIGDIVKKGNNLYLICSIANGQVKAYLMRNYNKYYADISINGISYSVVYDKKVILDSKQKYNLLSIYPSYSKEILKRKTIGITTAQYGSLLNIDNELYLVYGVFDDFWKAYKIYTSIISKNTQLYNITIDNKQYKTSFKTFLIPKYDEYDNIAYASKFDINECQYKLNNLDVKDKILKDNLAILDINNKLTINISKVHRDIISVLQKLDFNIEEMVGIMVALRNYNKLLELHKFIKDNNNSLNKSLLKNKITEIIDLKQGDKNNEVYG